ncbi:MAG: diguanylate cyclase [Planctomycetota bacterium]
MNDDFSFRDIVELAQDVVIVTRATPLDAPGPEIVYVNPAFTRLTGYSAAEAVGQNPRILQGKATNAATCHEIRLALEKQEPIHVAILDYTKDGREYWLDMSIMPLRNAAGELTHFVAIERDVTGQKAMEQRLRELAERDSLTGLYNRRIFFERLEECWKRFQNQNEIFSVVAMDIDHFKLFNDEYGHSAGDAVLKYVGSLILSGTKTNDTAARTGGEEFSVIMPGLVAAEAFTTAEEMRNKLKSSTVIYNGDELHVKISIGISEIRKTDQSSSEIIRRADQALYLSKERGRDQTTVI